MKLSGTSVSVALVLLFLGPPQQHFYTTPSSSSLQVTYCRKLNYTFNIFNGKQLRYMY